MQIFIDADACPVVDIVEKIAEKYNIKQLSCVIQTMSYTQITAK